MSDLAQLQTILVSCVLGLLLRGVLRAPKDWELATPFVLVLFTAAATFVACIQDGVI